MASRAEQKAAARAVREARQHELSAAQTRRQRLSWLGGLVVAAVVVVAIIVVTGGKSGSTTTNSPASKAAVAALLKGIPQNGNTLGNPRAPVTVTEFGDLVCPICRQFAVGSEAQLISHEVRAGKVKLVYRALETASQTANNGEYAASQIAAAAAGVQHRAWNYILLWYNEQGDETTPYVTDAYMQTLATQVHGLNLAKWQSDRNSAALANQVTTDGQAAAAAGLNATPSITFTGPKGAAAPIAALPSYAALQAEIKSVS